MQLSADHKFRLNGLARWGCCASSSAEIVPGLIEPLGFWLRPSQGMKNLEATNDCRYSASSFPCVSHNSVSNRCPQAACATLRRRSFGIAALDDLWPGPEPRVFLIASREIDALLPDLVAQVRYAVYLSSSGCTQT